MSIDAVLDPGRQVVNFLHGAATRAPLSPAPSTRPIKDARAPLLRGGGGGGGGPGYYPPKNSPSLPRRKRYPGDVYGERGCCRINHRAIRNGFEKKSNAPAW